MLDIIIGNNLKRDHYTLAPTDTIRTALEQAGVDFTQGMTSLDGAILGPGEINKTFAEFGYDGTPGHEKGFLTTVAKADNA